MIIPPPIPHRLHRLSVWQLVLGIVSLVLSLLSIVLIICLTLIGKTNTQVTNINLQQMSNSIWVLVFIVLLTLPSIIFAARRLSGNIAAPAFVGNKQLSIAAAFFLVWLALLYAGAQASAWNLPAFLTPILNILIVSLPILVWLALGLYRLSCGSQQRAWGIFNFSVFVTTQGIIVLEFILVLIGVVIGASWLFQQAEFLPYLSLLQSQGTFTQQNLQSLIGELTPMLNLPVVYAIVALAFCLLVPLIEELFKPLAVWLFAGKELTPSQGFSIGLICGAAFGLLESLSMISVASGGVWFSTAVGRVGTGLLHILTAGLSGWALAKTWQDHKYLRLSLMYLLVVLIHGTWNFFAVLMGVSHMAVPINSNLLNELMVVSPWVLVGLGLLMAATLVIMNHHLRRQSVPPIISGQQAELERSSNETMIPQEKRTQ